MSSHGKGNQWFTACKIQTSKGEVSCDSMWGENHELSQIRALQYCLNRAHRLLTERENVFVP